MAFSVFHVEYCGGKTFFFFKMLKSGFTILWIQSLSVSTPSNHCGLKKCLKMSTENCGATLTQKYRFHIFFPKCSRRMNLQLTKHTFQILNSSLFNSEMSQIVVNWNGEADVISTIMKNLVLPL